MTAKSRYDWEEGDVVFDGEATPPARPSPPPRPEPKAPSPPPGPKKGE